MPVRYRSPEEDSARWLELPIRDGDIVISTRSKSGTTWMQMICALLVFRSPDLPAPLAELSPWLDWLARPLPEVLADLDAQRHRRFLKTHTPLDGIPIDPRAGYVVVARHPLDLAVSLYHQGDNLDRELLHRVSGRTDPLRPATPRPPLRDWLVDWIGRDEPPAVQLDDLPGVLWHLGDAWSRRALPNVVLVHYDDLVDDLDGQMRLLADRLGLEVDERRWADLVEAARFDSMRSRAAELAPGGAVLKDPSAFFRRGRSGAAAEVLSAAETARYHARAAELAPPDLLSWLHRGR